MSGILSTARMIVLVCIMVAPVTLYGQDELPLWAPPHIVQGLNDNSTQNYLWSILQTGTLQVSSLLGIMLAGYGIYWGVSGYVASSTALFIANTASRLLDGIWDYMTSSGYGEFTARSALSNMDLFSLPWLVRRVLSFGYFLKRPISRLLPSPEAETLVYFHDWRLAELINIIWVPAQVSEKYDSTRPGSGFFAVTPSKAMQPCQPEETDARDSLPDTVMQLACSFQAMPEGLGLRIHLYPQLWHGENRLFLRLFRQGVAGPLLLSPYRYGDNLEMTFVSDLMGDIDETGKNDRVGRLVNPLHESSFKLLNELRQQGLSR